TVTGTIRDWSNYRRISELHGNGWIDDGQPETGERTLKLWAAVDRRLSDPFAPGFVRFREEWDTGSVPQGDELDAVSNWPLLNAGGIAEGRLRLTGESSIAGRPADLVEVDPDRVGLLIGEADREHAAVDRERGVLLRAESLLGDELLMVEEFLEISFD